MNTACTSCHNSGAAQFNSYNSGEHQFHVAGEGISCTDCHNTTALAANHFTNLGTTAMEGPASATIGGRATFDSRRKLQWQQLRSAMSQEKELVTRLDSRDSRSLRMSAGALMI